MRSLDSGEDTGFYANAAGVFAQGDVSDMMVFVFNGPVAANGVCGLIGQDWVARKVERGLGCCFPKASGRLKGQNASFDLNDGGDIRLPIRARHRRRRIEHGDGSGFMAVALFVVDCPGSRKRRGAVANSRDLAEQRRLVLF